MLLRSILTLHIMEMVPNLSRVFHPGWRRSENSKRKVIIANGIRSSGLRCGVLVTQSGKGYEAEEGSLDIGARVKSGNGRRCMVVVAMGIVILMLAGQMAVQKTLQPCSGHKDHLAVAPRPRHRQ